MKILFKILNYYLKSELFIQLNKNLFHHNDYKLIKFVTIVLHSQSGICNDKILPTDVFAHKEK